MVEYVIEYFTGSQRATLYFSSLNANYIYQVGKMDLHPNITGKILSSPIYKTLSQVQEIQGNFKASVKNEPFYYSELNLRKPTVYPVADMGVIVPAVTTPVVTTPVVTPTIYPVSGMGLIVPAEVISILTKFDNKELTFIAFDFKHWFQYDTNSVRNGTINSQDFLNAYNGFVNRELIIDTTTTTITPTTNGVVITPTTPTITISVEVQAILTKFDNNDYTFPSWFNNNITWVKDGRLTSNEFLDVFNYNLQLGVIIDKTIPVEKLYDVIIYRINDFGGTFSEVINGVTGTRMAELEAKYLTTLVGRPIPTDQEIYDYYNYVDTSIDENSITQKIGAFTIKDGWLKGRIDYKTTEKFNAYYYNKPIYSVVSIEDQYGADILSTPKVNNLNFTAKENTEWTNIEENVGDNNAVKIKFNVSKNPDKTLPFSLEIETEIVCVDCFPPCQIGQHRNFNGKCVADDQPPVGGKPTVLALLGGVTALIGTLALLGSKRS